MVFGEGFEVKVFLIKGMIGYFLGVVGVIEVVLMVVVLE